MVLVSRQQTADVPADTARAVPPRRRDPGLLRQNTSAEFAQLLAGKNQRPGLRPRSIPSIIAQFSKEDPPPDFTTGCGSPEVITTRPSVNGERLFHACGGSVAFIPQEAITEPGARL